MTSTDLISWTEDGGAMQAVAATSGDEETVRVSLSNSLLSDGAIFVRIRAE